MHFMDKDEKPKKTKNMVEEVNPTKTLNDTLFK
jgi:hypothetical protein